MLHDWYSVYTEALNMIDRDMGINYFQKSNVSGSYLIYTTKESFNYTNKIKY